MGVPTPGSEEVRTDRRTITEDYPGHKRRDRTEVRQESGSLGQFWIECSTVMREVLGGHRKMENVLFSVSGTVHEVPTFLDGGRKVGGM